MHEVHHFFFFFLWQSQREAHRMSAEENEIPVQTIAPSGRHGVRRYCRSAATKRGKMRRREVPWVKDVFHFRGMWFQPNCLKLSVKMTGLCLCVSAACVSLALTHTHSHREWQKSHLINLFAWDCTLIYIRCGSVYFISPTLIDLLWEVSPCLISHPSHRLARRLLPWTSTGSHSI